MNKGKLWGGRFQHDTHDVVEEFTASDHFDRRLASYDIAGSIAHARMLAKQEIIQKDDSRKIVDGLKSIEQEIELGSFPWDLSLIHI